MIDGKPEGVDDHEALLVEQRAIAGFRLFTPPNEQGPKQALLALGFEHQETEVFDRGKRRVEIANFSVSIGKSDENDVGRSRYGNVRPFLVGKRIGTERKLLEELRCSTSFVHRLLPAM